MVGNILPVNQLALSYWGAASYFAPGTLNLAFIVFIISRIPTSNVYPYLTYGFDDYF